MTRRPLIGRTIAVPESRELEVFAALLERRGARVLRCPLVAIRDAPDPQPVLAWCRQFAAGEFDDLILLTGEGLRRLLACIERHEPALQRPFHAALAVVRTITRGPKPAQALREVGVRPHLAAEIPTTAGVIALLRAHDLRGRRIAVQLYGTEANRPLTDFLRAAGAHTATVAPYVYADAADDRAVHAWVAQLVAGGVDAVAFTSSAQVERLVALTSAATARIALRATRVAVVGPLVAATLRRYGVEPSLMAPLPFALKPLTRALERALGSAQG